MPRSKSFSAAAASRLPGGDLSEFHSRVYPSSAECCFGPIRGSYSFFLLVTHDNDCTPPRLVRYINMNMYRLPYPQGVSFTVRPQVFREPIQALHLHLVYIFVFGGILAEVGRTASAFAQ